MNRELREFNPDRLIAELKDFAHDYKRGDFSKYRVTHIDAPEVPVKSPEQILSLRDSLRMSRGAFAKILNVPLETLRAWEKGRRNPSGAAARLLDMVAKMPSLAEEFVQEEFVHYLREIPDRPRRRAMTAKRAKAGAGKFVSKKSKKGKSAGTPKAQPD
jgi:putative transcriptional regulator